MEDPTPSKNWLANGNVRLAVIAAALVLVLAGTQLGSGDAALAAVDAVGNGDSDSSFVDDAEMAAAVSAATPTLTPTPVPVPVAEQVSAAQGDDPGEDPGDGQSADEAERQTPLAGTTLVAGTGTAVIVPDPGASAVAAELVSGGDVETSDGPIVCVLPEVPADTSAEAASDASVEATPDNSDEASEEGELEESVRASGPAANLWFSDTFEEASADWQPLSGSWVVDEGTYVQTDATGYDFISELNRRPPSEFRVEVDIAAPGLLNAGLILGQPEGGTREGATVIDFTEDGTFLRWGSYEAGTGQYRYIGGAPLVDFDPSATIRLGIERRDDRTLVSIDGREVATIDPIRDGRIGLVTSVSIAAFSDFTIEDLA